MNIPTLVFQSPNLGVINNTNLFFPSPELALGDQVTGIAGLKTQLQVAGTTTTTSTADISHAGEELDEMKHTEPEVNQASPLNGPNGAKVPFVAFVSKIRLPINYDHLIYLQSNIFLT